MSGNMPIALEWFGQPPQASGEGRTAGLAVALWRLDRDAPLEFRTNPLPDMHIVCAHLAGSIDWRARLDDRRYARTCLPNTACMARAGESADVTLRDAHASFIHFYLPTSWLNDCAEELAPSTAGIELLDPMNAKVPDVGRCAVMAARALSAHGASARLEIEGAALMLGAVLIRQHSTGGGRFRTPAKGGLAPWQLHRVCEAMAAAVAGSEAELGLAELAKLIGLGPHHFCRAFKLNTGLPPHQWLLERRIERLQLLLADPKLSLTEVALAGGYASQSAMGSAFRRATGLTPGAWRRLSL